MTSFAFRPEELDQLQSRGWLKPDTAARLNPGLAAVDARLAASSGVGLAGAQAAPQFSRLFQGGGQPQAAGGGGAPPVDQGAPVTSNVIRPRPAKPPKPNKDAETFAGIVGNFDQQAFRGNSTSIPAAAFPQQARSAAGLTGHVDLMRLDDDQYIMALRLAHKGMAGVPEGAQEEIWNKFRAAASQRPELQKKLRAMMEAEQPKKTRPT